jgi:hypothetical protein
MGFSSKDLALGFLPSCFLSLSLSLFLLLVWVSPILAFLFSFSPSLYFDVPISSWVFGLLIFFRALLR